MIGATAYKLMFIGCYRLSSNRYRSFMCIRVFSQRYPIVGGAQYAYSTRYSIVNSNSNCQGIVTIYPNTRADGYCPTAGNSIITNINPGYVTLSSDRNYIDIPILINTVSSK